MDVLIFGGSGKMGAAVAWDLVKQEDVEKVGLVGRNESSLKAAAEWVKSSKIELHPMDIMDVEATKTLMKGYDVGVSTLPDRRTSYRVVDTAIQAGLHIVDMLEEYHRRPDAYEIEGLQLPREMSLNEYGDWLHEQAIANGVTFLDGIGFAPGLSNITVGEGIRKLDRADSAIARVGGIPSKSSAARHPLRYMITWAFDHVLREYMVRLNVIKDGKVVEVNAATDRERFKFNKFGKDEELECAVTPGMPSFIFSRPDLQEFAEKTVRWPGHWDGIQTLKEVGMLDLTPVEIEGVNISPRDFLLAVIGPRLQPLEGDTDVCVMWNTVTGEKAGQNIQIDYYLWDEADTINDISSMARVTGFSAAIGALFIGRGKITQKGVVPPEDAFDHDLYLEILHELKMRDIHVLEEVQILE
jgi:lysine 6-dehydrogenase